MSDTDHVQQLLEELTDSFNRFLYVASVGELFAIAVFFGILAGIFQLVGRTVVDLLGGGLIPKG